MPAHGDAPEMPTPRTVTNGRVRLAVERIGPEDGEPLVLIMGTGGQLIDWPNGFCEGLVAAGFAVARFDNRDAGRSTRFAGTPRRLTMALHPARAAAYTLNDMAADAIAVIDGLGWSAAHLVGMSQGGMVAQVAAATYPDRVRSLTSISSTPSVDIGRPRLRTLARIIRVADPRRVRTAEDLGRYLISLERVTGSPAYPRSAAELLLHARRVFERGGIDSASVQRQTAAIAAAGDRRPDLAAVRAPTLVIHGEDDPLIRSEGGRATARAIAGARLVTYPGMGHSLPRQLWPVITAEITRVAGAARAG